MAEIVVNGQKFTVGRPTASQVSGIAKILSKINIEARKKVVKAGIEESGGAALWALLGELDEATLIEFAALAVGCDKEFARENFDLVWVTEAVALMVEQANFAQVLANFTRIFTQMADMQGS